MRNRYSYSSSKLSLIQNLGFTPLNKPLELVDFGQKEFHRLLRKSFKLKLLIHYRFENTVLQKKSSGRI